VISQKTRRSLLTSVGAIGREAEKIKGRFQVIGLNCKETEQAFKDLLAIQSDLKDRVKAVEVETDDMAAVNMFGKENLHDWGD